MEDEVAATSPAQNKALVLKAFDTLFNKRDWRPLPGLSEAHGKYKLVSKGRRAEACDLEE